MIEPSLIALYLIFIGLIVSLSAKTWARFLIGIELQVLGILLLMLTYASRSPRMAVLAIVAIALEALKLSAAIGLK